MGTDYSSWFHYREVRRSSAAWQGRPSGLGYYDIALYILLGRQIELNVRKDSSLSADILDLGTYFGHSAFCFTYGASTVSKDPKLNVLSIDIFEQPGWLLRHAPDVVRFVNDYGSTGPESIHRSLEAANRCIGLKKNPVQLMKRDVLTLGTQELSQMAPGGYALVAVDCAKSPELMNRVGECLSDARVCKIGTILAFQDLFDWHAPWNALALCRMMEAGMVSLNDAGPYVTPFAVKTAQRNIGTICDDVGASLLPSEEWCRPFTSLDNEMSALEQFTRLFRSKGYFDFAYRLECLKVGALLRAGRVDAAETHIATLDDTWPMEIKDSYLQNAFCRMMHLKTGKKDLSLVFDTPKHRCRNTYSMKKLRDISSRLRYLMPIRFTQGSQEFPDGLFAAKRAAL